MLNKQANNDADVLVIETVETIEQFNVTNTTITLGKNVQ